MQNIHEHLLSHASTLYMETYPLKYHISTFYSTSPTPSTCSHSSLSSQYIQTRFSFWWLAPCVFLFFIRENLTSENFDMCSICFTYSIILFRALFLFFYNCFFNAPILLMSLYLSFTAYENPKSLYV